MTSSAARLLLPSLGFLGCGNMGQALMEGILADDRVSCESVSAATRTRDISNLPCVRRHDVRCCTAHELAKNCDNIIVGVNFENCQSVLTSLAQENLLQDKLIISIVVSISCETLLSWELGTKRIVRAMPNTPCQAREGLTALCADASAPHDDLQLAKRLFECVGCAVCIPERLLPGWTCAAGCGPAYVLLLLEAVADAIVAGGLPRETANEMAAHITGSNAHFALSQQGSTLQPCILEREMECTRNVVSGRLQELGYKGIVMEALEAARDRDRYLEENPEQ